MLTFILEFQDNISFTAGILGFFIAIPLIAMRRQRFANIYLGMFLISFSILCIASTKFYYTKPQFFGLLDWPLACLGAFYYLYVKAMCGIKSSKKDLIHFIPLLIFSLVLLDIQFKYSQISSLKYFVFYILFFQAVTFVYAITVIILLKKYRNKVRNNYSSDENKDLKWLNWLTLTVVSLLIIWTTATIFRGIWHFMLILGQLLILFFVGWFGLRQNFVFIEHKTKPVKSDNNDSSQHDKYQRSGMNEAIKEDIEVKLEQKMLIEKKFLKSDLKLTELASSIDTSPQHLSEYFNQILGQSFFAYVNELRIEEAKRLLCDPNHQSTSILDIAFASGFNSKSTFNASFKKNCHVSPSAWKNQYF